MKPMSKSGFKMLVVDQESLLDPIKKKRARRGESNVMRESHAVLGSFFCSYRSSIFPAKPSTGVQVPIDNASRALLPKALSPGLAVEFAAEPQALEFFFLKTAPQLAGFFGEAFFQGSVLQLSLTEPAIRQAIGAIGFLHERAATGKLSKSRDTSFSNSNLHLQLYNRSIHSVLKASSDPDKLSFVATASVLFACFEVFHGNRIAAETHIKSGISLLNSWRDKTKRVKSPWGRRYPSSESRFMETQVAPLLSLFNLSIMKPCNGGRVQFMLNPVSNGILHLAKKFEGLEETRNAFLDMLAAATANPEIKCENKSAADIEVFLLSDTGQGAMEKWNRSVDDLVYRNSHSWGKKEQRSANALHLIKLSAQLSMIAYQAQTECHWDKSYEDYKELIRLCEAIVLDHEKSGDDFSRTMNIDCGLIFALHAGAWKCRWPKLRQRGLDLLLRIPKREWFFESKHYHQIFARIKEKEEEHLSLPLKWETDETCLPPEHVRIHNFTVEAQSNTLNGCPVYAVSFWSKPHGLDGPWNCSTETMCLESTQAVEADIPFNLFGPNVSMAPQH
ncbi:hypothetical protein N7478_004259 [Penicillium angulare]|uniref:uncharacterized protein n=1 Tax=Penicillium angulare TaxID=116970 RepID=UPI0025405621|nr:uncharacterized protein N7478_004259 [Penicillium angulare]KAJ5278887.1 hypothetical protein N7478_004259 [Penicillium angulare]